MKHILKIIFFMFLLTAYTQANAKITSCDVLSASEEGSQEEGEKKEKDGKKKEDAEEEEPDCD